MLQSLAKNHRKFLTDSKKHPYWQYPPGTCGFLEHETKSNLKSSFQTSKINLTYYKNIVY